MTPNTEPDIQYVHLDVRIDRSLHQALVDQAQADDRSLASLVRRLLRTGITRAPTNPKPSTTTTPTTNPVVE